EDGRHTQEDGLQNPGEAPIEVADSDPDQQASQRSARQRKGGQVAAQQGEYARPASGALAGERREERVVKGSGLWRGLEQRLKARDPVFDLGADECGQAAKALETDVLASLARLTREFRGCGSGSGDGTRGCTTDVAEPIAFRELNCGERIHHPA